MISCLHGMGMDTSEDRAPEVETLLKKLGQLNTPWRDKKAIITTLIAAHNIHPDAIKYGFNNELIPLGNAAKIPDIEFARFLLDHKANVNARVNSSLHTNDPVLFCAATTAMAQLLLDRKADVNAKGGRNGTLPLLCSIRHGDAQEVLNLIAFYAEHGVDACALDENGSSPLHNLVFEAENIFSKKLEKAQKLIEIGVSLDPIARSSIWGSLTFVQNLKVKIAIDPDAEDKQLLETVQKAVANRNARALQEVFSVLTPDPARIVLSYYVDQEKFDQTDVEIERFAVQVRRKRAEFRAEADRDYWGLI